MSRAYRKCILLLGFCLFGSLTVFADDAKWLLVTNDGTKLEMESVGSFVLAEESDAFDVLDKDGKVIAPGVKKVSFEYYDPTGINLPNVTKGSALLSYAVDKQLTIIGGAGDAQVYTAAGVLVASAKSKGGTIVIDVAHLAQGIYLVRTGKQAFKFTKRHLRDFTEDASCCSISTSTSD